VSPEVQVALIGLMAAAIGGLVRVWIEIRSIHTLVNSRMTELLELTRQSSHALGVLDEREHLGP
jgi:hypothetical protein